MNKSEVCSIIREVGILPAIRVSTSEEAHFAAEAVTTAGIPIVEIPMTVPGSLDLITHLIRFHPTMLVGAGTVLGLDRAKECASAGAHFITSPGMNTKVIEFARGREITVLPGVLTPTEVITAWEAGADFVKVFPCAPVGGEAYIRALKAPMPQMELVAAGGVNQQTAAHFIFAGATAIGVGTELIPTEAIQRRQAERIHELAKRFVGFVKSARQKMGIQAAYENPPH